MVSMMDFAVISGFSRFWEFDGKTLSGSKIFLELIQQLLLREGGLESQYKQ